MKKLILLVHLLYFSSSIFGQQYAWTILPHSSILLSRASFENNGALWCPDPFTSRYNNGILKISGSVITKYNRQNTNSGLAKGEVFQIQVDVNNTKIIPVNNYINTFLQSDTLCYYNGFSWSKIEIAPAQQTGIIYTDFGRGTKYLDRNLLIDSNNTVIFTRNVIDSTTSGQWLFEVYKLINNNWIRYARTYDNKDAPACNPIIDKNNNLWYASDSSLHRLDVTGNWTSYPRSIWGGSFSDYIRVIAPDNNGNIWLGFCHGSGIIKFDGTNLTKFTTTNSGLLIDGINDLKFDKNGKLWIANSYLNTYDLQTFDGQNWSSQINTPFKVNTHMGCYISEIKFAPNGNLYVQCCQEVAYTDFSISTSRDNSIQSDLKIYPNPTLGNLSISHPNVSEFETVEIYDVYGRNITVPHTFTHSTMELETQSLPAGYYTLSIKTPKGILRNSWIKQ